MLDMFRVRMPVPTNTTVGQTLTTAPAGPGPTAVEASPEQEVSRIRKLEKLIKKRL